MTDEYQSLGLCCTIRHELTAGDLGAILALHGAVYADECGYDITFEGYVARTLAHFAEPYSRARERVWLAEADGRLIACIGLIRSTTERAQLRWFFVAPHVRGRGLGRRLLRDALQFAEEARYTSVFLDTVRELPAAAHLYRLAGFVLAAEQGKTLWGQQVTEQRFELLLERNRDASERVNIPGEGE